MSNRQNGKNRQKWRYIGGLFVFLLIAVPVGVGVWWNTRGKVDAETPSAVRPRELAKSALILRDGRLYADAESTPYTGVLFESFPGGKRKVNIEIKEGKVNGRSVGYFENSQIEVEEFFTKGISHGLRTRWYENGNKKSEEHIEDGKLNGHHIEWHQNGNKAQEMTMVNGRPEGLAEAWYADGQLKSRAHFKDGKMIDRKFFPANTQPASPKQ